MKRRAAKVLAWGLAVAALAGVIAYQFIGWGLGDSDRSATYRLVGYWSEAAGQAFDQPYGIAVDPGNGHVLVTDAQHQRVVVFTAGGELVRQFGQEGDGPGEFALPTGIAVGRDGSVYVADYVQDRVQKFTGDGEFDYPSDVDVAPDGRLLVADTYNYRVQILDLEEGSRTAWGWELFWLWPRPRGGAEGFGETLSAAFAPRSGFVHVTDGKNRRLVILDSGGRFVTDWMVPGSEGKAQTPLQVAVSGDGRRVYATDVAGQRIVVLQVEETKENKKWKGRGELWPVTIRIASTLACAVRRNVNRAGKNAWGIMPTAHACASTARTSAGFARSSAAASRSSVLKSCMRVSRSAKLARRNVRSRVKRIASDVRKRAGAVLKLAVRPRPKA